MEKWKNNTPKIFNTLETVLKGVAQVIEMELKELEKKANKMKRMQILTEEIKKR